MTDLDAGNRGSLKFMLRFVFIVILSLASSQIAYSQKSELGPVEEFRAEYGPHWEVRVDRDRGTPISIFSADTPGSIYSQQDSSIPIRGSSIEEKAKFFLLKHAALFGIGERGIDFERDLRVTSSGRISEHRSGVRFDQFAEGLSVEGNGYSFYFNERKEIVLVVGRFNPNISVSTPGTISPESAVRLAREYVNMLDGKNSEYSSIPVDVQSEYFQTVIVDEIDSYSVIHVVHIWGDKYNFDVNVSVDAFSGLIDFITNVNPTVFGESYGHSRSGESGRIPFVFDPVIGSAFLTNPLDGGVIYPNLQYLTSEYFLDGTYTSVRNADQTRASAGPDFLYSSASARLDEVNVYHHISEFANHVKSVAGRTFQSEPAEVYTVGLPNNAEYNRGQEKFKFGIANAGAGLSSRDVDVIRHEYMHYAFYEQGFLYLGPTSQSNQSQSLRDKSVHEAQADFMAASYQNDPRFAEYFAQCSPTHDLRRLDTDPAKYNNSKIDSLSLAAYMACPAVGNDVGPNTVGASAHHLGMIWSGALWDARAEIGAAKVEYAVMGMTNAFLQDIPDFPSVATTFIDWVDNEDRCQVKNAFHLRGLSAACDPSVDPNPDYEANIVGPWTVSPKGNVTFSVLTSGGGGASTFDWYYRVLGTTTWYYMHTGPTFTEFIYYGHPDFQLKVDATTGPSSATTAIHTAYYFDESGAGARPTNTPEQEGRATKQIVEFGLDGIHPNPVRNQARVEFSLPSDAHVVLAVYDLLGRQVATATEGDFEGGSHSVQIDTRELAPGVYLYRMTSEGRVSSKRLTVVH